MKSTRSLLFFIAILLLVPACGYAQAIDVNSGNYNDVGDQKGILPYGTYNGGDIDQVNLQNGNLFVKIPLFSLPQLGKLKLSFPLVVNGQGYEVEDNCDFADGGCGQEYYRAGSIGPVLTMDQSIYLQVLTPSLNSDNQGYAIYLPPVFTVFDGTGATHPLIFDNANTTNLRALDGSGYSYFAVPGSAPYNPFGDGTDDPSFDYSACTGDTPYAQADGNTAATSDGIMHTQQEGCWGPDTPVPPILMKDPNGNQISYNTTAQTVGLAPYGTYPGYISGFGPVTDSVSRTLPDFNQITHSDVSMCPNLGSSQPAPTYSKVWTVPGPNGGTSNYTFCMTTITYNTNFGGSDVMLPEGESDYDPQAIGEGDAIQSVILPNGKYWGFLYSPSPTLEFYSDGSYDSPDTKEGYGDLREILLPTGGSISYTYASREACSTTSQLMRFVKTRTVNDANGGSAISTYDYQNQTGLIITGIEQAGFFPEGTTLANPVTTVTDPDGNDTVHTYSELNGIPYCSNFAETETDQYSGSASSGKLLKTTTRAFSQATVENISTQAVYNNQPSSETETLTNGAPVTTTYTYPTLFSLYIPGCTNPDDPTDCSGTLEASSPVNFGQPTEQQITSSDANSEKTVQTAYKWQSDSTFLGNNLLSYPYTVETETASGAEAAKTTYGYDTYANLTSVSQDVTAGSPITTGSATYNSQGMPNTTTDGDGNTTTISYETSGLFPNKIQQPLTHIDYYSYDDNTGNVYWHTDENGSGADDPLHTTTYSYDVMGRSTGVTSPLTAAGQANTTYCYTDTGGTGCSAGSVPYQVYATTTASPDPSQQVIRTYDGLGRPIRSTVASDPEGAVSTDTVYNGDGQVAKVSNPYRGSASAWTQYAYDGLGRVFTQTQPDGSTLQWCYNDVATNGQSFCGTPSGTAPYTWADSLDEINNHWQRSSDYFSNVTQVLEPNPSSNVPTLLTTYQYNPLNNLTNVAQAGIVGSDTARTRTFSYDGLSRLLSAANPESGATTYTYDNNGNVLTKMDARSITATYTYDTLNRILSKAYSDGSPSVAYSYDTASSYASTPNNGGNFVGRLSSVTTTTGDSTISAKYFSGYDAVGRLTGFIECGAYSGDCASSTGEVAFSADYSYDLAGNVIDLNTGIGQLGQLTPENSDQSAYRYFSWDAAGRLNTAEANTDLSPGSPDFQATAYSPFGGLTTAVFPDENNNPLINVSRSYDPYRMWLSGETDSTPVPSTLYGYSLTFQNNGNVSNLTDSVMGGWSYGYSHENQLTSGTVSSGAYNGLTLGWTYDDFGNRTAQTPSGTYTGTVPAAQTLGYNGNNQITSGLSVTYDAAGNVTEDPSNQYRYDGEGRLCAVYNNGGSGAMTAYVYDGDGNRVAKGSITSFGCDPSSNGFTLSNAYVLGQSGEQLDEADSTGTEVHSNTFANGQLLSTYDNITSEWTVALNDWLGTKRLQVDPAIVANLTSFTSLPYGDALTPSGYDATEQHFTGKERDAESGLDYFGARYYGSSMGRFMSPDPSQLYFADPTNPQSLNLYSYALNNPLTNADPTGIRGDKGT